MRKILNQIILIALIIGLGCGSICKHVHTEECGENGVDCTHKCQEEILIPNELKPDNPPK